MKLIKRHQWIVGTLLLAAALALGIPQLFLMDGANDGRIVEPYWWKRF